MDKNDLANKLFAGNFDKSKEPVTQLSDPLVPTPMVLTLDQIRHYELNPRVKKNPIYEEIRTSILKRGFNAVPSVTRRPGQDFFILRDGFNTRLSILNELWKETKREDFYRFLCQFYPWDKEIKVLTGHLSESLHGSLTHIERAEGVKNARKIYEEEAGRELSVREIANLLTDDGFPVKYAQVHRYFETIEYLLPFIPQALYSGLGSWQAQKLVALRRQTKAIYQKYKKDEHEESIQLFENVLAMFDDQVDSINLNRFKDELIGEMSQALDQSYNLIALEFEDKAEPEENNKVDLSNIEINEAELLSKPLNLMELSDEEIINLPMPQILRTKGPSNEASVEAIAQKSYDDISFLTNDQTTEPRNDSDNGEDNFDNDEQFSFGTKTDSNIDTNIEVPNAHAQLDSKPLAYTESPKVEAIKNIIAQASDHIEPPSQPVPATSGFFPVKDIWQITPELEDVSRLQQHIGQLAYEIANEFDLGNAIELTERDLGYMCIKSATNHDDVLVTMLDDLSQPSKLSAFLLGNLKQFEHIARLSDESLIKLFRIIRLARKLYELEQLN